MRSLTLLAATLLIPATAAAEPIAVERDGMRFRYTNVQQPDGTTVLEGLETTDGRPFRLVVRGRSVTGEVDGRPVAFRIARPLAQQVAAR